MKISQDKPLNRAFLSINFYISTADHVGEGIGAERGDQTIILVPVNTTDATDIKDLTCLEARLEELKAEKFPVEVAFGPQRAHFKMLEITVPTAQLDAFALKLREKPGSCGWGSMKAFLEQHGIR